MTGVEQWLNELQGGLSKAWSWLREGENAGAVSAAAAAIGIPIALFALLRKSPGGTPPDEPASRPVPDCGQILTGTVNNGLSGEEVARVVEAATKGLQESNAGLTERLNAELGNRTLTEKAVEEMLETLGRKRIPRDRWPAELALLAEEFGELQEQLYCLREAEGKSATGDTYAAVQTALDDGRSAEADRLLAEAQERTEADRARILSERARIARLALDHVRAAGLWEDAARATPEGTPRDRAIRFSEAGDAWVIAGRSVSAWEAFNSAGLEFRALAEADPNSAQAKRDLSVSHNKIGDVLRQRGDGDGALQAYRKDLELAEALAKADPNSAVARIDLAISHSRMIAMGKEPEAHASAILALVEELRGRNVEHPHLDPLEAVARGALPQR